MSRCFRVTIVMMLLLCLLAVGSSVSATGSSVFAAGYDAHVSDRLALNASGGMAINIGPSVLEAGFNTENAAYVRYGGVNSSYNFIWRVIDYNGKGYWMHPGSAGNMTLFADECLCKNWYFGETYSDSSLRLVIRTIGNYFSNSEKSAIVTKTFEYNVEYLWPLSSMNARSLDWTLRCEKNNTFWWLIDTKMKTASYVGTWGSIYEDGNKNEELGIRPAFNLRLDAVALTTDATYGKVSGETGPDALTAVGQNQSGEWKLTIKDDAHKNFKVLDSGFVDEDLIVAHYEGAAAGENEYISAVIVSKDGVVKYYGRVAEASAEDGAELKIKTSEKFGDGDRLYVFNEQYYSDQLTDYSSDLIEIGNGIPPEHDDRKANPLKVRGKTVKMKSSDIKKKTKTFARKKVLIVKGAKGKVTYRIDKATPSKYKKYFKIDKKTGRFTVKKGLKKGTYKIKAAVTAAGNSTYARKTRKATITVKVK